MGIECGARLQSGERSPRRAEEPPRQPRVVINVENSSHGLNLTPIEASIKPAECANNAAACMAGFPGGGMRVHAGLEKAPRTTQPAMIASPPESMAFPPEPIPGGIRFQDSSINWKIEPATQSNPDWPTFNHLIIFGF